MTRLDQRRRAGPPATGTAAHPRAPPCPNAAAGGLDGERQPRRGQHQAARLEVDPHVDALDRRGHRLAAPASRLIVLLPAPSGPMSATLIIGRRRRRAGVRPASGSRARTDPGSIRSRVTVRRSRDASVISPDTFRLPPGPDHDRIFRGAVRASVRAVPVSEMDSSAPEGKGVQRSSAMTDTPPPRRSGSSGSRRVGRGEGAVHGIARPSYECSATPPVPLAGDRAGRVIPHMSGAVHGAADRRQSRTGTRSSGRRVPRQSAPPWPPPPGRWELRTCRRWVREPDMYPDVASRRADAQQGVRCATTRARSVNSSPPTLLPHHHFAHRRHERLLSAG